VARAALATWAVALCVLLIGSSRGLPSASSSSSSSSSSAKGVAGGATATAHPAAAETARLEHSLDPGGRSALAAERGRIGSALRRQMEEDSLKQKHARTGEWRRLKRPRDLTAAELEGYHRGAGNEELRLLRILAAQTPCGDRATCAGLARAEVADELHALRRGDLFVSRAALASDAAMRAAFGASAANASDILFAGGDDDEDEKGKEEEEDDDRLERTSTRSKAEEEEETEEGAVDGGDGDGGREAALVAAAGKGAAGGAGEEPSPPSTSSAGKRTETNRRRGGARTVPPMLPRESPKTCYASCAVVGNSGSLLRQVMRDPSLPDCVPQVTCAPTCRVHHVPFPPRRE